MGETYCRQNTRVRVKCHAPGRPPRLNLGTRSLKLRGSQTRHLMPYALELAKRFQRPVADPFHIHDRLIAVGSQLCCDIYGLMMSSGLFFMEAARDRIVRIDNQMPQLYQRLYVEAYNLGVKTWKTTPKTSPCPRLTFAPMPGMGQPVVLSVLR